MATSNAQRAFTLIELLIVVAIIAILAAISIPNLLEAQTRARISRVRSDMRALGLALEAYRSDHHAYPPAPNPFVPPGDPTQTWLLTTPIAYMTTIPRDPFFAPQPFGEPGGPFGMGGPHLHYINAPEVTEYWLLWSYGPDRDMELEQLDYDATNGTVSDGDLYRVGAPR